MRQRFWVCSSIIFNATAVSHVLDSLFIIKLLDETFYMQNDQLLWCEFYFVNFEKFFKPKFYQKMFLCIKRKIIFHPLCLFVLFFFFLQPNFAVYSFFHLPLTLTFMYIKSTMLWLTFNDVFVLRAKKNSLIPANYECFNDFHNFFHLLSEW